MNSILSKVVLLVLVFFGSQIMAQTVTNKEALNELAAEFAADWELKAERVKKYAEEHNVPIRVESDNGKTREMVDVRDGIPMYYITDNLGAAHTTRAAELWPGGSTGLDLNGAGYDKVAVWDAGAVLVSHQEFTDQGPSRVTKKDGNYPSHFHATHVGGTIAAAGIKPEAKGMAYQVHLDSYQWTNDNNEMASAAAAGLEISNHSYGFGTGWDYNNGSWTWLGNSNISPNEDYRFGFYSTDSRSMDQISYNAPNYLIVRSAGNDRGEGPSQGTPENDGGSDGYDCISHDEIAKNILTVGAVREVWDYENPGDVKMSSFSCWGPADDGRIKPDIVGKGVDVYSTMDGSNTDYGSSDGTSMSAPNVTGTLVLLQQHYQNLNDGTPMRSATLKGLALHTADECGEDDGPDYIFGWGLLNAKRAAQLISDDQGQVSIDERVLTSGDLYSRVITVPEGTPELRVTICWTDPPAIPVSPSLNPRDRMIINDLDLRVIDPSVNPHYPYSLDPENPSAAATTDGKNYVDNVEMVVIKNPVPGNYSIYVDHDGSMTGGQQAYSLIISGIDNYDVVPECSIGMSTPEDGAQDILVNEWLSWEPANFAVSYDIYFGTDGGGTQTPTNVYNGENILTNGFSHYMEPGTTYYLQVVPRNSQGPSTDCNTIWQFTTMDAINNYPYSETVAGADYPDPPFGWQAYNFGNTIWVSTDLGGHTDSYSMICWNPDGVKKSDYDNWMVSPPFEVVNGKVYNISYYYKTFLAGNTESMTAYWGTSPYIDDLTNVVYADTDFNDAGWLEGQKMVEPGFSGNIYIGFHVESTQGYGVFLDDIMVEDKGVGTGPEVAKNEANIYSFKKKVMIQADESWSGSKIQISNLMGQLVYSGEFHHSMTIDLSSQSQAGLFIVKLANGNDIVSKKVMIQ